MGYFAKLAKDVDQFDAAVLRYGLSHITENPDGTVSLRLPQRWIVDPDKSRANG